MVTELPDRIDFENARKGFVARLEPGQIIDDDGRVVFDADIYATATEGACPDTVNPSLWRQSQLTAIQGLFEVSEGIYQLRGLDLSNMTVVEGDTGVIIIDPATVAESAKAGLELYRKHRGDRDVEAVIFTHSHVDHFGGVLGVVDADTDVPIVAPDGFMENAVSEMVYAGTAMARRTVYHLGSALQVGPTGTVGAGLGTASPTGSIGLLAPTLTITHTGQEETFDGVRIVFQLTPDAEAPAEMNFYFPDLRALCMAENTARTLHNLYTLRGAQVRDARAWSRYIAEAIDLFGPDSDVMFASHHWPTWGTENILEFLALQRDLYGYLHDQTLRLMNDGYVASEIAEMFEMPPAIEAAWHTNGYYGSVSHNVKAVYQRYLGWYDGNPAHLWQHPPEAAAKRYVDVIGGVDATVSAARRYVDEGDLRFAAELGSHAVFADPDNQEAKELLAEVFTQLGYGAECGTWRNQYLAGAAELLAPPDQTAWSSAGMAAALTITQLFDSIGIRINGPRAWDNELSIRWHFTDANATYRMELSNGVLIHHPTAREEPADLVITLTKPELVALIGGNTDGIQFEGDPTTLQTILSLVEAPQPNFAIVTP